MTGRIEGPPHDFDLDDFQIEAIGHVDAGDSVVVSAPTGSGKTFIAEHAIAAALGRGRRSVYTTPIKALSNQKYRDLGNWIGQSDVGLLTGDNTINPDAPVLVMTTEVLRNILYSEPDRLHDTGVVVMDEVHYLQDNYRGPVWEEVIIHLPDHITLVALSATVSNADQLASWISEVHSEAHAVTELTRPVALESSLLVGDKQRGRIQLVPVLRKGKTNADGRRYDLERRDRQRGPRPPRHRPWRTPRRPEVVKLLDDRNLLPVITFIFSRAGCEDAVDALVSNGVVLTTADEANSIAELVDMRTAHLESVELDALGFSRWRGALVDGVGAHHAGMVPLFKEIVEELFAAGLLRAIFATETLALGINMPARSVVIERLTKFTGEHHESLTPGDYTQLTGRAGRRGIDERGYAFVLWSPFTTFDELAGLARSKSFHLRSAFRPTYNMACHFVGRYSRRQAEALIAQSFGQFQANAAVDELVARRDELRRRLGSAAPASPEPSDTERRAIQQALSSLRPGQIIDVGGTVAVLSVAWRRRAVKVQVIDREGSVHQLDPDALEHPPVVVATVELDKAFDPHNATRQEELLAELRKIRRRARRRPDRRTDTPPEPAHGPWVDASRRDDTRELRRVEKRIRERRGRLTDRFAAVVGLLTELGYVDGWKLTPRGDLLKRTYHELDLVVAESLQAGHLDGLSAVDLAAVVSVFVFEPRSTSAEPSDWVSGPVAASALDGVDRCHREVRRLESAYGLPESRDIDRGLFAVTHGWAAGGGLDDVLVGDEVSAGDFVRTMRQIVDVLAQLSHVAPDPQTRRAATEAVDRIRRGIVESPLEPIGELAT